MQTCRGVWGLEKLPSLSSMHRPAAWHHTQSHRPGEPPPPKKKTHEPRGPPAPNHYAPRPHPQPITSLPTRKLEESSRQIATLTTGLAKMAQARTDVAAMQERLTAKTAELETAAAEAQDLLRLISESTGQAEKDRQRVATIVEGVTAKVPWRARASERASKLGAQGGGCQSGRSRE